MKRNTIIFLSCCSVLISANIFCANQPTPWAAQGTITNQTDELALVTIVYRKPQEKMARGIAFILKKGDTLKLNDPKNNNLTLITNPTLSQPLINQLYAEIADINKPPKAYEQLFTGPDKTEIFMKYTDEANVGSPIPENSVQIENLYQYKRAPIRISNPKGDYLLSYNKGQEQFSIVPKS